MPGPYAPSDARNYVGIGKQGLRGSGQAPALFVAYLPTNTLNHTQTIARIFEAGVNGQPNYVEKVSQMPTGQFIWTARPATTTKLFAYMMGVDTVGAPISGVYPHVITEDFNSDYLSVEENLANAAIERFVDSLVAEIVLTADRAAPVLRCQGTWFGCNPGWQGSPTAVSYESELPFTLYDGAFTVDGNSVVNVRRFQLTIRMRLSVERIAKVIPEYIVKVGEEADLEIENLMLDENAEYRLTNYGGVGASAPSNTPTAGSFVADFTRGSAGTARQAKFELPTLDYDEAIYTPLTQDAQEAVAVTRKAAGRAVAGSPFFRMTGKTLDSAAYV